MALLDNHRPNGPENWNKKEIKKATEPLLDELYEYAKRIYAEGKQSVLIVLQGMDASGKDGLTRSLFQKVSPAWVNVHSFKKPTDEEFAHDFLWRIHKRTPEKGMITVFNRSHYEDILVPSVYGYIDQETIDKRYDQINQFEQYLEANGTKVLKFYLNVSYDKQHQKLTERINTKEKHWKHSDGDWETRDSWNEFMDVYDTIFERCNSIPWHIIPCDHNWTKLYSTAKIVIDTLKEMDPQFPDLDTEKFTPDYSKSKYRY
ncbi:MAG: polyphosphate kinase [Crocinitomicaceae bacterium]|nr:polyphosphate kinase [Crocinitomicaceae bacterium]